MEVLKESKAVKQAKLLLNKNGCAKNAPFKILVDAAFLEDKTALYFLGDCFYRGDFGAKDICLAKYIYELAEGKTPKAILQYKEVSNAFSNTENVAELTSRDEEELHLSETISRIDSRIFDLQDRLGRGSSAYFMEQDIQADFTRKNQEVYQLTRLRSCPYYGRLDVFNGSDTKTYYISEENLGLQNDIVSVWSPFGRHYRQKLELEFSESGIHYIVKRRRELDIEDGKLIGILDTYVEGNEINSDSNSTKTIFDPFLQKVLEQKRGESNISNIIRSIQTKQNDIIDFDFDKSFIVQGCPGSGKTMILLHRLANLKYNRPNTRWGTVKIITPNEQFNAYVDSLSENLGINMIPRRSIAEYYLEIIQRYADDTGPRSSSAFSKIKKQIKADNNLPKTLVSFLYSNEFATLTKKKVEEKKVKIEASINGLDKKIAESQRNEEVYELRKKRTALEHSRLENLPFSERRKEIRSVISDVVEKRIGSIISETATVFYQSFLYAEVLLHYYLMGAPKSKDRLLCIDEGQDISQLQYLLLYRINGDTVCFNIYGDINQKMQQTCGVDQWNSLQKFIKEVPGTVNGKDVSLFHLSENYRNSEEVVSFYNTALRKKDRALGIKIGRVVQRIKADEVETFCKFHWLLKNRIVIIANTFSSIPLSIKSICIQGEVQESKVSLMTITEVKGLEFDVVLVYDQGMNETEKYIAYTRCLSELYIIDDARIAFECNE